MDMHRLSLAQALGLWSDLEAAFYGENKFGGDTAEIYIYRLLRYSPGAQGKGGEELEDLMRSGTIIGNGVREDYDDANESLHNLLVYFAKERHARIEVNGKELGAWLKTARFTHRVHVKVEDTKARKPADPRFLLTLDRPYAIGNIKMYVSEKLDEKDLDRCCEITFKPNKEGTIDVFAMEERDQ